MNRGLEQVTAEVDDDGHLVLVCFCDCATTTRITIEAGTPEEVPPEFAYTCDGCQSSHWISFKPVAHD